MQSSRLERELRENIEGDIYFDDLSKSLYSVDASLYEQAPIGIVQPKTEEEVGMALAIAFAHGVPIVPRGAGTGLTGGCVGEGLVIDTSRYLTKILSIDLDKREVVCQVGVVADRLNEALRPFDMCLGPETSTSDVATLGGMIGNHAAGARSLRYGTMIDAVNGLDIYQAEGQHRILETVSISEWNQRREKDPFYQTLDHIRSQYTEEALRRYPSLPRRASGYALLPLVKEREVSLAKLFVGSEGTLGVATKATLAISPLPGPTVLCVLEYRNVLEAMEAVVSILDHHPLSFEMMDHWIVHCARQSPLFSKHIDFFQDDVKIIFLVEFDGESLEEAQKKGERLGSTLTRCAQQIIKDPKEQASIWALRKAGLGLLLSRRSYTRALTFIEDLSIPPQQMASFFPKLTHLLSKISPDVGIYGHVGAGCLHIRPYLNLLDPKTPETIRKSMQEVAQLVLEHGGAMSGEHGDGRIRSWLLETMYGSQMIEAFQRIKGVFDPHNRMNPGKIVSPCDPLTHWRHSTEKKPKDPSTYLSFSQEGGLALAVDLCNGNGHCRKKEGVMCPSFHVTGNEYDSTRARAQALRSWMKGQFSPTLKPSRELHDILDLCIQCKGCKKECPSEVDMAKIKSEFLYQYQKEHGFLWRNHLFGNIDRWSEWGSQFPQGARLLQESWLGKKILSSIGITEKRPLPRLSPQRFSISLNQDQKGKNPIILFTDTYTEFYEPDIGIATQDVVAHLGYHLQILPYMCCGRPLYSKGLLPQAKQRTEKWIENLYPYALKGIPILVLEPSCASFLRGEAVHSLPLKQEMVEKGEVIAEHLVPLEMLLDEKKELLPPIKKNVHVHTHCHDKADLEEKYPSILQKTFPENVHPIRAGCCGMAGSFGYEKEHHDFSLAIGEQMLFPQVRCIPTGTAFLLHRIAPDQIGAVLAAQLVLAITSHDGVVALAPGEHVVAVGSLEVLGFGAVLAKRDCAGSVDEPDTALVSVCPYDADFCSVVFSEAEMQACVVLGPAMRAGILLEHLLAAVGGAHENPGAEATCGARVVEGHAQPGIAGRIALEQEIAARVLLGWRAIACGNHRIEHIIIVHVAHDQAEPPAG